MGGISLPRAPGGQQLQGVLWHPVHPGEASSSLPWAVAPDPALLTRWPSLQRWLTECPAHLTPRARLWSGSRPWASHHIQPYHRDSKVMVRASRPHPH